MINLGKPSFGREEIDAVSEVIRSGWVGRGKNVEEFEKEFAAYSGAKYAVAVNGCTVGLYLCLKQRGIGPGDEVIVPSMTWNATAAVVVAVGATPVFADIRPGTWCLDPVDVKSKITARTKLVIPVHYSGVFAEGFEDFEIPVLYDSAHRIQKNGFTGITAVHSFYVTKNITTVRGGMVLTNDKKEYRWLTRARTSGIDQDVIKRYKDGSYKYEVEDPSWNFDMSDIEAAIGRVQLKKIDLFTNRREEIVAKYNQAFNHKNTGNHLYTILVENRDAFITKMREAGIQCGVHYFALHQMKGYQKYRQEALPITEYYSERNVSMPLYYSMTNVDIQRVIANTQKFAKFAARPTVTVGISAYNEEKNIVKVINGILSQKQTIWNLQAIKIYCDGCTDNTAKLARSVRSSFVEVIDDERRLGKVGRIKQLIQDSESEITVIFDADIKLEGEYVIDNLVLKMDKESVVLVGGNTRPFAPKTFFERAVYATFRVFDDSRKFVKDGNNIFGCNGGCIAVRSSFAKTLSFVDVINEDDFLYFSCLTKGYQFRHAPNAIVYYKISGKLTDHLRQLFRSSPDAVITNFSEHFGDLVAKEYRRPIKMYVTSVIKAIIADPLPTLYIIIVALLSKPFYQVISKRYKLSWYTAVSTK